MRIKMETKDGAFEGESQKALIISITDLEAESWMEELERNKEKRIGFWQSYLYEWLNDFLVELEKPAKKKDLKTKEGEKT